MSKLIEKSKLDNNEKGGKRVETSKNFGSRIADAFKGIKERGEIKVRVKDLLKKVFSEEKLSETDYQFIVSLPKKDLDKFIKNIVNRLDKYVDRIRFDVEIKEREPSENDILCYKACKKLFDYIAKNRKDVEVQEMPGLGIRVQFDD